MPDRTDDSQYPVLPTNVDGEGFVTDEASDAVTSLQLQFDTQSPYVDGDSLADWTSSKQLQSDEPVQSETKVLSKRYEILRPISISYLPNRLVTGAGLLGGFNVTVVPSIGNDTELFVTIYDGIDTSGQIVLTRHLSTTLATGGDLNTAEFFVRPIAFRTGLYMTITDVPTSSPADNNTFDAQIYLVQDLDTGI